MPTTGRILCITQPSFVRQNPEALCTVVHGSRLTPLRVVLHRYEKTPMSKCSLPTLDCCSPESAVNTLTSDCYHAIRRRFLSLWIFSTPCKLVVDIVVAGAWQHGRCHPQTFRQAVHQSSMFPPSFVKDNEHKLMPFITQLFNRSNGVFLMQFKSPSLILSFWTHPKENPLLVILSQRTSCRYTQSIEHISEYIETISHCLIVKTRQPTKHSGVMSIWLLAIFLTKAGSVAQVVPTTDGLTSFQLRRDNNNTLLQLTCGEDPPHVVIREWRYGPRRITTISATDHIGHSLCHIGHKQSPYRPQTTSTIDDRPTHSTNVL